MCKRNVSYAKLENLKNFQHQGFGCRIFTKPIKLNIGYQIYVHGDNPSIFSRVRYALIFKYVRLG